MRRIVVFACAVGCSIALAGCSHLDRSPTRPGPAVSAARTPIEALRLFESSWEGRSIESYELLFTEDFRFAFATSDTSGNAYLERGFRREDELACARHLFQGGRADQPAASRITMDLDHILNVFPDSRPGKTHPWHVEVFSRVVLSVDYAGFGSDRIDTSARFFLVRGDSAAIPPDLVARLPADSTRWYIERYEEENASGSATNER
jgi:hypothetical protein